MGPSHLIRRRRLQDAAAQIRDDPYADLSTIVADLGYTDHAHLTNDFRNRLGLHTQPRTAVRSMPPVTCQSANLMKL